MGVLLKQVLADAKRREARSLAMDRVLDVLLPILVVLCLCLWRERHNVLQVKNGEVLVTQVYGWGCFQRELRRASARDIASVSVEKVGVTRGGGGFAGVVLYDLSGRRFNVNSFGDNKDNAYRHRKLICQALSGKFNYSVCQSTQSRYLIFAIGLALITLLRWYMIRVVRKSELTICRENEFVV